MYYQIRHTRYLLCTVIIHESTQLPYKAPRFFQGFAIFSSEVHYWSTTTALFLRCSHQSPTIRTLLDHNSVNRLVIQLPPHYLDGIADVLSTLFGPCQLCRFLSKNLSSTSYHCSPSLPILPELDILLQDFGLSSFQETKTDDLDSQFLPNCSEQHHWFTSFNILSCISFTSGSWMCFCVN